MVQNHKKYAIIITTKDRVNDLLYTLQKIKGLLKRPDVQCHICDDGSSDRTSQAVKQQYPEIDLLRNETSKGLIFSRNRLISRANAEIVISIDDDLHFLTESPLEKISGYFDLNPDCALVSFRIFWSKSEPETFDTRDLPERVRSFAGGAHAFKMAAWKEIPEYPSWFLFYGEEDFAGFQLFKIKMEIHYLPQVLVLHRVDLKSRKSNNDYVLRMRRAMRSPWYLYFLFVPISKIPKKMAYSLWMHFRLKIAKGNGKALYALLLALADLALAMPKIIRHSNRLTGSEYKIYTQLKETKIYWKPEK